MTQVHKTIFITGPSASGKSTISRSLARQIGFSWLDTGSVIRMTALVMENAGVRLPESYDEALETPCPPWVVGDMTKPTEIAIAVGGHTLDYDNPELRNPRFDTNTLFLARALRSRTWGLLEDVARSTQAVISSRRVPDPLLIDKNVLPIYLDLSPRSRLERRASYEGKVIDAEITDRVLNKELENTTIGNLVTPTEALHAHYILVQNEGSLDRSIAQLMLEVINRFESYHSENQDETVNKLLAVPVGLKHYSHWSELVRSLKMMGHPEGQRRNNELK